MTRRFFSLLVVAAGARAQDRGLGARVQNAVLAYLDAERRQLGYLYVLEQEERRLSASGAVTGKELNRLRYEIFEGGRAMFATHRNGVPVTREDRLWQEDRIRSERAASRDPESADRRDAAAKVSGAGFAREVADAFDFVVADRTQLNGRPALVIEFEPRDGYRPRAMKAKAFTKARGRVWLDHEDSQLAKLEAEIVGDVSLGGILASAGRGSKFDLRQERLSPGNWMPVYERTRINGRVLMVKAYNEEDILRYSEYRRR